MLWKRHHSIYGSSQKVQLHKLSEHQKQPTKFRNGLIPLLSAPLHQSIQPNQNNKFAVRKQSKSKQSRLSPGSFFMHRGNNHQIVKMVLQEMGFSENLCKQQCCLIWYQGKQMPRKDFIRKQFNPKAANYLLNHNEITNKQKLFQNISYYFPQSVGKFIPKTYIVDFKDNISKIENNLSQFLFEYFKKAGIPRGKKNNSLCISNYYGSICIPFFKILKLVNEQMRDQTSQSSNLHQNCLWIVKPSFLNRGQGIQVISNLKQLQKMLSQDNQQISVRMYQPQQKNTPSCFVIQQYIMDPLLYLGYKFDIRVWVLLKSTKHGLQVYIYKKAYTRLAGHKYIINKSKQEQQLGSSDPQQPKTKQKQFKQFPPSLKPTKMNQKTIQLNDKFVHLTNNAVQKNCKQYGSLYEGNQILLSELVQKLSIEKLSQEYLYQNFNRILKILIESSKEKLNCKASYGNFQLIGLDFMIDSELQPLLRVELLLAEGIDSKYAERVILFGEYTQNNGNGYGGIFRQRGERESCKLGEGVMILYNKQKVQIINRLIEMNQLILEELRLEIEEKVDGRKKEINKECYGTTKSRLQNASEYAECIRNRIEQVAKYEQLAKYRLLYMQMSGKDKKFKLTEEIGKFMSQYEITLGDMST